MSSRQIMSRHHPVFWEVPATWCVWHVVPTQSDTSRQSLTCLSVFQTEVSRSNVSTKTFRLRHFGPIQCCCTALWPSYGPNKGFYIDLLPCYSPTGSWHTAFWHVAGGKWRAVLSELHPKAGFWRHCGHIQCCCFTSWPSYGSNKGCYSYSI